MIKPSYGVQYTSKKTKKKRLQSFKIKATNMILENVRHLQNVNNFT